MISSSSSAHAEIGSGLLVFLAAAMWGLGLFWRGLRDDVRDHTGIAIAGRRWFIWGGLFLQLPLLAFLWFIWSQGYFSR